MTCDFISFSTVFQSYQDDERLIMKGCVQWNPIHSWEDFTSSGARTRDRFQIWHSGWISYNDQSVEYFHKLAVDEISVLLQEGSCLTGAYTCNVHSLSITKLQEVLVQWLQSWLLCCLIFYCLILIAALLCPLPRFWKYFILTCINSGVFL